MDSVEMEGKWLAYGMEGKWLVCGMEGKWLVDRLVEWLANGGELGAF